MKLKNTDETSPGVLCTVLTIFKKGYSQNGGFAKKVHQVDSHDKMGLKVTMVAITLDVKFFISVSFF